ncbi:hypothetical protein OG500_21185 [Kitasatospora sp. NBC_01250]|uniref:hypothetical protein n=1 Tax=unclassified Kitasatospora TaxID=2633591 RepID=UPI002E0F155B|nr:MULTISPECIES: hypothetical protein [unclassified Kitasatospora]WSJ68578.1 hypothetical protein OG294_22030 [Kitasatospora sp. NBC_01302]
MTQPTTAHRAALGSSPAAFPAQRTAAVPPRPSGRPASVRSAGLTRLAAMRRGLAIVCGVRSMSSVPARPQPGYGESDGQ